ncbi:UNVERIFIED_CONTAM: putative fasciclin-like arabinogalactan protein 20 [Sesamum latifolium]|uniref:Fasciclin-like arabinogalactan protein 20 n=1 Tax=Sesamum latifolium TaxID=2727402 RepID=A0AAW2WZM4_9LAMI
MASLQLLLPLFLTLSAVSAAGESPPPPPPPTFDNAAETLASSGYTAMSLTLQLIAPPSPSPPIPSPPSPYSLRRTTLFHPPASLHSPNSSSISPLFPSHLNLSSPSPSHTSTLLKSRGYSIVATFLELQLMGFLDHGGFSDDVMKWTVFAPVDEELVQFSGDFLSYFSLFMRHVVPCKVGWSDIEEMVNGTVVSNNVKGFSLEITRDENDEIWMVNGVDIMFPDMYESEWLVIHGIRGVISLPENAEDPETESMEEFRVEKVEAPDPESMEDFPAENAEDPESESMEEFRVEKVEAPDPESMEDFPAEKVEAPEHGEF